MSSVIPKTLWVATVDVRHVGPGCIGVFRTETAARRAVADWCRTFWVSEGVEGDPPKDDVDLIDAYFEWVGSEDYNVEQVSYFDGSDEGAS